MDIFTEKLSVRKTNNSLEHSKALITAYSANYCKEALALNRNGFRMLIRVLTGHWGLE